VLYLGYDEGLVVCKLGFEKATEVAIKKAIELAKNAG
jgi:hypothetical protein